MAQRDVLARTWLDYVAAEATFGVDPGTGGTFPTVQTFLELVSPLVIDGAMQAVFDNLDANPRRTGTRDKILGLKSGSKIGLNVYAKGLPTAAAMIAGATPAALSHRFVYAAMFGAEYVAAGSTVAAATSATVFTVADAAAGHFLPGTIIAVANNAGTAWDITLVQSVATVGGHPQVTVSPALSAVPSVGNVVRNGYNYCPADQKSMVTMCVRHVHGQDPALQWLFQGCAGDFQFEFPKKWGESVQLKASLQVAGWQGPAALGFPAAPIADDMQAPVRWLPTILLGTRGAVDRVTSRYQCDNISLNIPTKIVPIPDPNGLEGIGGWMDVGGRPTAVKLGFDIRLDPDEVAAFSNRTARECWIIWQIGTGLTATFLVWHIPEYLLSAIPKGKAVDDRLTYEVMGEVLPDTGVTNAGATGQARDFRDATVRFSML